LLELAEYQEAEEAFSRCVQLDETDAEAGRNMAAALLRNEPEIAASRVRGDESREASPAPSRIRVVVSTRLRLHACTKASGRNARVCRWGEVYRLGNPGHARPAHRVHERLI